jgi:hypothetical protein
MCHLSVVYHFWNKAKKISLLVAAALSLSTILLAQPIGQHPDNPNYFIYHGKPTVLITSGEHYGAVVNLDFDYDSYLEGLANLGLNHTRVFLGDYVETPGAFCIEKNTLAPASGRFISPWDRSNQAGFAAGGNKFNLDQWNPSYFSRLHSFMQKAEQLGIVVEAVLFFVGPGWNEMPLNPINNINGTTAIKAVDYMTLSNGNILTHQKRLATKLIDELNRYENLIVNVANEPWYNNQEHDGFSVPPRDETKEWIRTVSNWIVEQEQNLPNQHLLSVDYMNEGKAISK